MLFREKSTTRHCLDCGAPNPHDRETCYSCGTRLDRVNPNAALPGERTFPCLNCSAPIPFRAAACASCGRLVAPQSHETSAAGPVLMAESGAFLIGLPDGWAHEALPDGTVRVYCASWWKRILSPIGSGIVGAGAFSLALFVQAVFSSQVRHGDPNASILFLLLTCLFVVVSLAAIVGFLVMHEDIRVGPGRLEMRRELLGRVWLAKIDGVAVVRVDTADRYSRSGAYRERILRAENLGARVTLSTIRQSRGIFFGFDSGSAVSPFDESAQLGQFIADITGWQFVDPAAGRL